MPRPPDLGIHEHDGMISSLENLEADRSSTPRTNPVALSLSAPISCEFRAAASFRPPDPISACICPAGLPASTLLSIAPAITTGASERWDTSSIRPFKCTPPGVLPEAFGIVLEVVSLIFLFNRALHVRFPNSFEIFSYRLHGEPFCQGWLIPRMTQPIPGKPRKRHGKGS